MSVPDRSRATRSARRVPGAGEPLRRAGRIALLTGLSMLGSFAPLASVAQAADWPMVQGTRIRAELVYGSGAIFGGPSPPFARQPIEVDTFGRASKR